MSQFKKINAEGETLPPEVTDWVANLDTKTGLMWAKDDLGEMTWKKAGSAVAKLNLAGFTDWRLPTVEELFCLADRARSSPAIDTAFFPDCKSDWYWTGTVYAPSPGACAWDVGFSFGYSFYDLQDDEGFVRAVRAGQ